MTVLCSKIIDNIDIIEII